jgi:hypothetical protein
MKIVGKGEVVSATKTMIGDFYNYSLKCLSETGTLFYLSRDILRIVDPNQQVMTTILN